MHHSPGTIHKSLVACALAVSLCNASAQGPERPADVHLGHLIHVDTAAALKPAIARARGGDTIVVDPGVTLEGSIELPVHPGDEWVTVRSAATLPEQRLARSDVDKLWTVVSRTAGVPPLTTAKGAHHWRVVGLHLTQTGGNTYGMFRCGEADGWTSLLDVPHHIELDRSLVDIDVDKVEERRGVQMHCDDMTVRRSIVYGMHEAGADSQALGGWEGVSRLRIFDNEIVAASEPILFGGASSSAITPVPQDIEIRGNWIHKPRAWIGRGPWNFKNLLELKSARRVVIAGNLFETNWPQAQTGWSILFTARGSTPWMVLEDVLFEDNVVRDVAAGVNILGFDNEGPSGTIGRRITVRHNLILTKRDLVPAFLGDGRCYMLLGGANDVVIDHNTCIQDGTSVLNVDPGRPTITGFVFTNNVQLHQAYGVIGSGLAPGLPTILALFTAPVFERNVFADCQGTPYPAGTFCPSLSEFWSQFRDPSRGDYRLTPTSPFRKAGTDGEDLGADLAQ